MTTAHGTQHGRRPRVEGSGTVAPPLAEATRAKPEPATERYVLGYTLFRQRNPWVIEDRATGKDRRFATRDEAIAVLDRLQP